MSIEARAMQYGKIFGGWKIRNFIGEGSHGRTGVFRIIKRYDDFQEENALKVVTVIREDGWEEELTAEERREFEANKADLCAKAVNEVKLMNLLAGDPYVVSYLNWDFCDWEEPGQFGCDLLIQMSMLKTLARLQKKEEFNEEEIRRVGRDICKALISCGERNIIHRDIKPANIFIRPNREGNYMLGDFGISRIVENGLGGADTTVGTPDYAAPEQYKPGYDSRVDIYSLGLTLYTLANHNRLPFQEPGRGSSKEIIEQRRSGIELPPPSQAGPVLREIILKACAFRPEDRFQTAEEFLDALEGIRNGEITQLPVSDVKSELELDPYVTSSIVVEKEQALGSQESFTNCEESQSLDYLLSEKMREISAPKGSANGEEKSGLTTKAHEIKAKNFMKSLEDASVRLGIIKKADSGIIDVRKSLIPVEYENDNSNSNITNGKHFLLPNLLGIKTIIFEVYTHVDYNTFTKFYSCEVVDSVGISPDSSGPATVYYIDDPQSSGNQLVVLHFNTETREVYINMGMLLNNELKITKKPDHLKMRQLYSDDVQIDASLPLSSAAYGSIPDAYFEESSGIQDEENEKYWEADISETPVFIIDPETAEPVAREVYYDESTGKWKARIKILSHKSYFAFQMRCNNNEEYMPLTDLEIATYYRTGKYRFPKDVFQAISYYEKDGSAEAFYEIATLFRTDKTLLDKDAYLEYLEQAADMGSEKASIELAIQYSCRDNVSYTDRAKRLLEKVSDKDSAVGMFFIGYLIESGVFSGGAEEAFDWYIHAAEKSYKPALARLCCDQEYLIHKEELFSFYMETMEYGLTIAKYCMGCIHFFGLGIFPDKPNGIEFLIDSANMGNEMAANALSTIYDIDPEYGDDSQALFWLKVVMRFDPTVTVKLADHFVKSANRLLDGIGCDVCDENDRLAFELLQKAAESGDKVAMHNLGWLYKEGRGCSADYETARKLFESAERANSFYWLGEMYEKGLGGPVDMEKAIDCYKKGAELGSKKAKMRIEELNPDDTTSF